MLESIREFAVQILSDLNARKGRVRNIMDRVIREQRLVDPDKSFLSELVYGAIRWRGNLDWVISQFVQQRKLKKLQPEIIEILRIGIYQLLFLNSVPDYAAVNESVEIAKKYGYDGVSGLVNAVLRSIIRSRENITYPDIQVNPTKHIAVKYSHPEWLIRRWIHRYGVHETIQLCSANNLRSPLYIRTNVTKTSRDRLIQSLQSEGVTAIPSRNLPESIELVELPLPISELSSYRKGMFQVQDEGSMLVSYILDPKPGDTVIDACAAPGGKSTHIAELMRNTGKIYAFDIDARRLSLISENCQRLGIDIVEAVEADARDLDEHLKADRVLVDVPCTGMGVLRRRIETRWRRVPDDLKIFPKLQYEILASAARHVKLEGILVYCTCTIEPEENHQVVMRFLEAHPHFQLQNALPFLPVELHRRKTAPLVSKEGCFQSYPHLHGMDGFFVARMINTDFG